jgi:hypothetical protein
MSALSKILRDTTDNGLMFWCPGCNEAHRIRHGDSSRPCWTWNGDAEKPTFTPSVLVTSGHYMHGDTPGNCYCDVKQRIPDWEDNGWKCIRCHSFVTDGQIQFLSDCSHAMAGQTVPLPDFPRGEE